MFKALLIAGWVMLAANAFLAFAFLRDSRSQDAAGRGMAHGIGVIGLIALAVLAASLLLSGLSRSWWLLGGSLLVLLAPSLIYLNSAIERTIRQVSYKVGRSAVGVYSNPAQTAAAKAIAAGDLTALSAILASHPNLNGRDAAGYDLLSYAVSRVFENSTGDPGARISAVRLLLEAGMDVNAGRFPDGESVLSGLVWKLPEPSAARLFHLLLDRGADANSRVHNAPILFELGKSPELAAALLDRGAAIEGRDPDGNTPLLFFVMHYQWDAAQLLLSRGADIGASNSKGETLDSLLGDQVLSSQQMQEPLDQGHVAFKAALESRKKMR
jgi:hypothetical protein